MRKTSSAYVRSLFFSLVLSTLPLCVSPALAQDQRPSGFVDVHMHIDGISTEQGGRSGREANRTGALSSVESLIEMMDEYGVEKAIVMPPPQGFGQKGSYAYEDLLPVIRKVRSRLAFAAGGGALNPIIDQLEPDAVTENDRRRFERAAEEIAAAGAAAFGEMTAMHLCLNPRHHFIAPPPDHPLFLLLADIAARHDMPIDFHLEAIEKDRATPPDILSACSKNPGTLPATIPAFERLLRHNRKAVIVWQHIGWDNTGEMTVPLLRRLLKDNMNLYLAIKATNTRSRGASNAITDPTGTVRDEWLKLFEEFPDRFVVGSDEFARGNVQGGYRKPPFFEKTWRMLDQLPSEMQKRLGRDNARALYRLD